MLRTILTYPDDVLRGQAKDITNIDGSVVKLAEDMAETMYLSRGVGLAAPQVGESLNLIVVDIGEKLLELYNPRIVSSENSYIAQEG
jgi:peptide deformylase